MSVSVGWSIVVALHGAVEVIRCRNASPLAGRPLKSIRPQSGHSCHAARRASAQCRHSRRSRGDGLRRCSAWWTCSRTAGRDWSLPAVGCRRRAAHTSVRGGRQSRPGSPPPTASGYARTTAWTNAHALTSSVSRISSVVPGEPLDDRFDVEVAWLRACHDGGATMASACSGAVLLAEAGLLAGCEATIHWAFVAVCTVSKRKACERTSRSWLRASANGS